MSIDRLKKALEARRSGKRNFEEEDSKEGFKDPNGYLTRDDLHPGCSLLTNKGPLDSFQCVKTFSEQEELERYNFNVLLALEEDQNQEVKRWNEVPKYQLVEELENRLRGSKYEDFECSAYSINSATLKLLFSDCSYNPCPPSILDLDIEIEARANIFNEKAIQGYMFRLIKGF